jgi:hypothetical protein
MGFHYGFSCSDGIPFLAPVLHKQPDCSYIGSAIGSGFWTRVDVKVLPRPGVANAYDVFLTFSNSLLTAFDRSSFDTLIDCAPPAWAWSTAGGVLPGCFFPYGISMTP